MTPPPLLNQRYRVLRSLGSGGFGETWLAEDTHLPSQRRCVIKCLKPQIDNPEVYRLMQERFEREAVLLEKLGADSGGTIPQLYAYFAEEQRFYLVQEWIDGLTLSQVLQQKGAFTTEQIRTLLLDLLPTLDYIHRRQVIHRDLKPDNIMLRQGTGQAVLIDFGIAKEGLREGLQAALSLTSPGVMAPSIVIGTPGFMPPEQLQGRPVYATDLYSLGLTAIALVTGRPPQSIPLDHRSGQLLWQADAPQLDLALALILNRAIQVQSGDRYPSASAMLAALQATQGNPLGERATSVQVYEQPIPLSPVLRPPSSVLRPPSSALRSPPSVFRSLSSPHRQVLLNKVCNYWIHGVLERSLHQQARLLLGWTDHFEAIEHPWRYLWMPPQTAAETGASTLPTGTRVIDQFDRLGQGRTLLILGEPGSGKTITLLELAQTLLERAKADPEHPIPVVFNLSSWGARSRRALPSLAYWLVQEFKTGYQVSRDLAQSWLQTQALVLLLDGLDEVQEAKRGACVEAINQFSQDHGQTEIVVCCRRQDYAALAQRLRFQGAIALQPLSLDQVQAYLRQAGPALEPACVALPTDPALQELVRSPLMLSMFAIAYQQSSNPPSALTPWGPERSGQPNLEDQRRRLFQLYIERMLSHPHISQRSPQIPSQRPSQRPSRYTQAQMYRWLRWLAHQMQHKSQTVLLIERLQPDWLDSHRQRWGYAIALGLQGGLLIGGITGVNVEMIFRNGVGRWSGLLGLSIGLLTGLVAGLAVPQIEPVETLHWSWAKAKASLGMGIRIGLLVGISMGLGSGGLAWMLLGPTEVLSSALTYGFSGLGSGLIFVLLRGLSGASVASGTRPNQGMYQSARNALGFMLLGILTLGSLGLILNLPPLFGALVGVLFGCFSPAGLACLQHWTLRMMLLREGVMPWNYARFLDAMTQRSLLQQVGGGYLFIHRLLLEHLAAELE